MFLVNCVNVNASKMTAGFALKGFVLVIQSVGWLFVCCYFLLDLRVINFFLGWGLCFGLVFCVGFWRGV